MKKESQGQHNHFPEDDFDLEGYKKKVLTQKRERFWKRNSRRFSIISTLCMIALFVMAYFAYFFLADFIAANFTFLR